jgi:hypothetical protein
MSPSSMLSSEEESIQKMLENLELSIHHQWVMLLRYLQSRTFFNELEANLSLSHAT